MWWHLCIINSVVWSKCHSQRTRYVYIVYYITILLSYSIKKYLHSHAGPVGINQSAYLRFSFKSVQRLNITGLFLISTEELVNNVMVLVSTDSS